MSKEIKYQAEPFATIYESVIETIDVLPREEQYPTLKAILTAQMHPMENYSFENVNTGIYRLGVAYKGIEVEE